MKRIVAMALMVMVLVALSGCETMKGLGKDIENLGESMQKSGESEEE